MENQPFKLFDAYTSLESKEFFGRDDEISTLFHLLKQSKLVLVYGQSGVGKTSLIQAGLAKVYRNIDWQKLKIRRRFNINESLHEALNEALGEEAEDLDDISEKLESIYWNNCIPVYLIFDQFEEVFTLGTEFEQDQFFKTIKEILKSKVQCRILLSMREEYLGYLYHYESEYPGLFDKKFRVEQMRDLVILEVIKDICKQHQIRLEPEEKTSKLILEKVKKDKQFVYLPYLQVYLHYLYVAASKESPLIFSEKVIDKVGDIDSVLKHFIYQQIEELDLSISEKERPANFTAQHFLAQFVSLEGTKQSLIKTELTNIYGNNYELVDKTLQYFCRKKLLREVDTDFDRFEFVHDEIARQVNELTPKYDKDYRKIKNKLKEEFEEWLNGGKGLFKILKYGDLRTINFFKNRFEDEKGYQKHWKSYVRKSQTVYNSIKAGIGLFSLVFVVMSFVIHTKNGNLEEATNTAIKNEFDAKTNEKEANENLKKHFESEQDIKRKAIEDVEKTIDDLESRRDKLIKIQYKGNYENIIQIFNEQIKEFVILKSTHGAVIDSLETEKGKVNEVIKQLANEIKNHNENK